ncbi:MAG TPA: hypothetical protein VG757_03660 [Devosia sp.]|nr:hypothetical protein [Devosia sp.]
MSHKEMTAAIMVLGAIVISAWVAWSTTSGGLPATGAEAARNMLWAIGYVIGFNIVAVILGTILVSIVRREELRDEATDERDRLVNSRAMRNGYFVLSIGVLAVLFAQAFGLDAVLMPYALFGISMLAGAAFGISQLVYYRLD